MGRQADTLVGGGRVRGHWDRAVEDSTLNFHSQHFLKLQEKYSGMLVAYFIVIFQNYNIISILVKRINSL